MASGEWTVGINWSPAPSVPTETATFTTGAATTTIANNSGAVNIGSLFFTAAPNAPAYTFNLNQDFTVNGAGITNNSTSATGISIQTSVTERSDSKTS